MTPPPAAGQPIRIVVSRRHAALHAEFDLVELERDERDDTDLDGDFDEPDEAEDDDELLRELRDYGELDEDERDVEDH